MSIGPGPRDLITDVDGISVGNAQSETVRSGVTVVLLACTLVFAELIHLATGLPYIALVLALAPGGIAEMGLVALAMGSDPLFVATHHVVRLGVVVLVAPMVFKIWRRWS